MEIKGTQKRIPDGIVYVNGLPVVVLEFKSAVKTDATIKKYHSEKVDVGDSWEHSKVELKPLNPDYDTIELNDVDGYRTIGIFKGVIM